MFEKTISLNQLTIDGDTWFYNTKITIRDETYGVEVWGAVDDDGDVRTSGRCVVDGNEWEAAAFGINIFEDGNLVDQIDDIDIIECE